MLNVSRLLEELRFIADKTDKWSRNSYGKALKDAEDEK